MSPAAREPRDAAGPEAPSAPGLGAVPLPEGGVRFEVWAPRAREVAVRLPGRGERRRLEPAGAGHFAGVAPELAAGADYLLELDGGAPRPDPASRSQPRGVHGPSRVVDPLAFAWSDGGWRGVDRPDLVLYELHVGTATEAGTFVALRDRLPELRALGVTALELMPVAEFPGPRNWGYDGVFPFAPQSHYGGPDGLRALVDAAHGAGLAVLLDVVYNHLGPEGNVLRDFGPYFTDRYRTPWGEAINFDGPESDAVRRYFLENALHWVREHHLDGLRLDAVHAIHDASARPFLQELAEALHREAEALGRPVHAIAESDANDPRLVRPAARGGLGLDAVWSDDFHHAVHARLTGERSGYYADFGSTGALAKAFAERFVLDGGRSAFRRRRHGAPARDVPWDHFVVFVQNHDQVGNRAGGERLASLVSPERLRLAAALLGLAPGLPLLFMGEEWGETNPFLYFVSHSDPALLEAVRAGRRRELADFHGPEAVPDPAEPRTFERSRPEPARAKEPAGAALRALYRDLLALRRHEPALRPGAAEVASDASEAEGWLRVDYRPRRPAPGARPLAAAFALGEREARPPLPASGGPWRRLLDTRARRYGGPGDEAPEALADGAALALAPGSALLYAADAGKAS